MHTNHLWHSLSCSVRGASHIKNGLPNQDYGWPLNQVTGADVILSVADGHGSARSFRSDMGSRFAAFTAKNVLQEFLAKRHAMPSLSSIKEWAENGLPKEIVRGWRERVQEHIAAKPISSEELDKIRSKEGDKRIKQIEDDPVLVYGSTLLCALLTDTFILYAQLGDGDILAVTDDGTVGWPLPKDERLMANETTSLCLPKAWDDFRVVFKPVHNDQPALVLLSTDGYANSFRDETGFLQAGADYLELIREEGIEYVETHLPEWLNEASQSGSGDDVTLAIGYGRKETP